MIRPLRQLHQRTFMALGFFLPLALALGILARQPFPVADPLAAPRLPAPPPFPVTVWERNDLFGNLPIRVTLLRETQSDGALAVELSATKNDFIQPDLMAYWVPGNPPLTHQLPDHARLLGGFNADALPLPPAAATTNGVLVLYSLANNAIVEVSQPIRFNEPTP